MNLVSVKKKRYVLHACALFPKNTESIHRRLNHVQAVSGWKDLNIYRMENDGRSKVPPFKWVDGKKAFHQDWKASCWCYLTQ